MKRLLLMTAVSTGAASMLFAETIKWTAASGDVQTASNWTPAKVPGASDTANVKSGSAVISDDFTVADLRVASDWDNDVADVRQTAGRVTVGSAAESPLILGANGNSEGRYYFDGGELVIPGGQPRWGNWGYGLMRQTGGTCVSSGRWPSMGGQSNGSVFGMGVLDIAGGTFTQTDTGTFFCLGEHGPGYLSVSGSGVFHSDIPLNFAVYESQQVEGRAVVRDGGTLEVSDAYAGAGQGSKTAYFSNGILRPCGAKPMAVDFFRGVQTSVGAGGITVDTCGKTLSLSGPLVDAVGKLKASNLAHRWSFTNGSLADSVGGSSLTKVGSNTEGIVSDGRQLKLPGGAHNSARLVSPTGIFPDSDEGVTIEMWATLHANTKNYDRVFSINENWVDAWSSHCLSLCWSTNNDPNDFVMACWSSWISQTRFAVVADVNASRVLNREEHLAVTVAPTASGWEMQVYRRDSETARFVKATTCAIDSTTWRPADFADTLLTLGYSFDSGNPDANASYNEVRIWKTALSAADLDRSAQLGPDADFTERASLVKTGAGTLVTSCGYAGDTEVREGTLALATELPYRRWSFTNGSLADSIASAGMEAHGGLTYADDRVTLPGAEHEQAFLQCSPFPDCSGTDGVTLELYATLDRFVVWQRLLSMFDANDYWTFFDILWSWENASDAYDFWKGPSDGEISYGVLAKGGYPWTIGTEYHVAMVFKKTSDSTFDVTLARRDATTGAVLASGEKKSISLSPQQLQRFVLRLGWAHENGQKDAAGTFDEVRVWKRVLTDAELTLSVKAGKDRLPLLRSVRGSTALPSSSALTVAEGASLALADSSQTVKRASLAGAIVGPGALGTADGIFVGGQGTVGSLNVMDGATLSGDVVIDLGENGSCDRLVFAPGFAYDVSAIRIVPANDMREWSQSAYAIGTAAGATLNGVFSLPETLSDQMKVQVNANGDIVLKKRLGLLVIVK